jgi:glycosyltransferase involved in cell wall biosynthesis
MPVYNATPFLVECLESILAQSYRHWELIAINDFSTDDSKTILEKYQEKYPNIKVLDNTVKGIIPALQLAYSHSRGELITRMDADDKMSIDKLASLQKLLLAKGNGHVAVGKVRYFSEQPLGNGYQRYEQWLNGLMTSGTCFEEIYKECVIPSPSWMVWREDFDRCQAFSTPNYPEDYDLCFRFYENRLLPIATEQVVHHWRDYPNRTSRNDPNYADNRFLELKLHYFLKIDRVPNKPLVIWGAGKKGKKAAQYLLAHQIPFTWICNNPNKIGKHIYEQQLLPITHIETLPTFPQILILIAQPDAQEEIRTALQQKEKQNHLDYFFFC